MTSYAELLATAEHRAIVSEMHEQMRAAGIRTLEPICYSIQHSKDEHGHTYHHIAAIISPPFPVAENQQEVADQNGYDLCRSTNGRLAWFEVRFPREKTNG